MAVGTSNYPTSLDTVVELVEAANNAADTLNGGIDAPVTTLSLSDSSEFAASGIVAIDNELISYTGKSGNTLTGLTRGIEGTSAASHSSGAAVRQVITAASHNVQSAAIIALENKLGTGTDIAWSKMAPLTASRMLVSDSAGDVAVSPLTHDATNVVIGNIGGLDFDTTPVATPTTGRMVWDDTHGTVNLTLKGGNVGVDIGQIQVARVVNKTTSNINLLQANYQVVRIVSAQGQRLAVNLAQANSEPDSTDILGLVAENINLNQEGYITTRGLVTEINTTGSLQGETWADGDILYLSPSTAGGLTKVEPQAPNHLVIVGYVVYAHSQHGKIFVAIQTSWETKELHDVKITGTPAAGSLLIRNATTGVWENATLTAGSNITITNADKSITIASTASGSGDVVGPSSATDNALARFDTTTGKLIQNSLITLSDTGALSFPDGVRQTFNPNGTNAGINVGAHTSDPSSPINGDLWYNSTASQLKTRRGAATEVVATIPSNLGDEIPVLDATTGNLSATGEVFWDGGGNALQIGNASTGALRLVNATGTDSFTLLPPASGGAVALTLPPGIGSSGQALTSNGTGGTSWSTITAGVSSVSGTSPVVSSGGSTPAISLASGYGDTQNPYASKKANNFLAAPNGTAGVPSFRAIVAADIPTLNQNTTGTASNVTGTVAIANGGTGAITASAARTNLGATTVGDNLFTLTNPSAVTFPRFNADNTVTALNAADFRTAIGAGTGNGTVTSVTGTSPVASSGGATPAISLSSGYGDTQNPYGSKTANLVLAGPSTGAAAAPTFRSLVDDDIPNTLTVSQIPNLTSNGFVKTSGGNGTLSVDTNTYLTGNQTITLSGDVTGSGSTAITTAIAPGVIVDNDINAAAAIAVSKLAASTISGVALGNNLNALTIGTGLSGTSYNGSAPVTVAIDSTVATLTGSQTLSNKTLSSATLTGTLTAGGGVGSSGQVLQSTGTGVQWATVSASPGGSNTQVQFNDSGVFGGNAGFAYNKTTNALTVGTFATPGSVIFPTSTSQTITLQPSASTGTYALTLPQNPGLANQVLTTNGAAGVLSWTTPVATPGGSNTQIQFNDSNTLNGDAGLVFDKTNQNLTLGASSKANELRLRQTGSGTNYVALRAPNSIASSVTLTLPVTTGTAGQVLITDGTGLTSWATASSGGAGGQFVVKNTSGATANANDVGYIDSAGEYKTTTTEAFGGAWCVVVTGAANGSNITVARRGKVIITLNANCSIGDRLVTSTTAGRAKPLSYDHYNLFAVALTANSSGAGGTCEALLYTGTTYQAMASNDYLFDIQYSASTTFTGSITAISGTQITFSVSTGAANALSMRRTKTVFDNGGGGSNTNQLTYLVIRNTTSGARLGQKALVEYVSYPSNGLNVGTTLFTTVASNWVVGDTFTIHSDVTDATALTQKYIEWEFKDATVVPALTRSIMFASIGYDGTPGNFIQFHPYETYGVGKGPSLNIETASIYGSFFTSVVLVNRRITQRRVANNQYVYSYIIGGMVAVP